MSFMRCSHDAGHRPKYLVVVDGSEENKNAIFFASRRAVHTGFGVVMLSVAETPDNFEWVGVGEALRLEAKEKAEQLLEEAANQARDISGIEVERMFREGRRIDEIKKLIEEDSEITMLVLASGSSKDGPGPIITSLLGKNAGQFLIPIIVVPGALSDNELMAITG